MIRPSNSGANMSTNLYNVAEKNDYRNSYDNPIATITCLNGMNNMDQVPENDMNGTEKTDINKLTRSLSKVSTASQKSKTRFSDNGDDNPRSWWYAFCLKCRSKESTPETWEPKYWSFLCPFPYCPHYRDFSRFLALIIIGVVSWCILYTIAGDIAAPPNGQLFQLLILVLAAKFGGWLISLTNLPGLIGMLFVGMVMQNLHVVNIDDTFNHITKHLRRIALVIILTRAGLDLDPSALRRLKWSVLKLGLGPWFVESVVVAIMSKFCLNIPWDYSFALGAVVAAVSPAVTVVCLIRLRSKGFGVAKGIPTLIIAIAGIDDAVSVAVFGIIEGAMFSVGSLTSVILQAPISIVGGIGFGLFWGILCRYTPERNDPYVAPLRILLLLVGCSISVFGSETLGYSGAGPLGCVTAAFTALVVWSKQGWDIEKNPASEGFEILWMFFEPILFSVTGAQIKFSELDGNILLMGLGILVASSLIRIASTAVLGIGCGLNLKEKFFTSLALMAKATVQAALGPVILGAITDRTSEEHIYANKVMMVCILSIMLTAPISAILMTILGPRLLTRTNTPFKANSLRTSHRASVRSLRDLVVAPEKHAAIMEEGKENDLPRNNQGEIDKTKM
ncbi:sodium/hydrogen exchanger 9B1 isoform X3 [Dendroctonus ponderosae]|uniref:Cation/H+ exchanger transmembrane domain-containing protein n=1 Tax=Dendroctonus ponderosae TaxID=77166 RepID=A0AAR5P7V1_DENPD|nr:sodium/hydrogen exchanger 9B1 isoform X3 [Dendroctonus ponderosae]